MVNELYTRVQQELQRQREICFKQSLNSHNPDGSEVHIDAISAVDLLYIYEDYRDAAKLLSNSTNAQKYLHSKGLKTYGDLLDMHDRIISHVTETDPKRLHKILKKVNSGSKEPEFMGSGRGHLNIFDFLVAIPNIPHSADPEQPTILGLLLSASQAVLRDERFVKCPFSHHDFMHMLLTHGVLASGYAHTTTGEAVSDSEAYLKRWPPENNHSKSGTFLFNDFTIKNAIAFHPEAVLLTVHPRTQLVDHQPSAPWQAVYNIFDSGRAAFVFPPDDGHNMQDSISFTKGFTPDFMRAMHSLITRG